MDIFILTIQSRIDFSYQNYSSPRLPISVHASFIHLDQTQESSIIYDSPFLPSPPPISNPSANLTVSTFQIYSKYSNHISPCLPVPPQPKTLSSLAWIVERVYQLVFSCLVLYCLFFTQHPESLLKYKIRTCRSNYKNCQVFSMILRMKLLTYHGIQDLPCSICFSNLISFHSYQFSKLQPQSSFCCFSNEQDHSPL